MALSGRGARARRNACCARGLVGGGAARCGAPLLAGSPSSDGWGPPQGVPHRASGTAVGRRRAAPGCQGPPPAGTPRSRAAAGAEGGAVVIWPLLIRGSDQNLVLSVSHCPQATHNKGFGSKSCVACQPQATHSNGFGSKSCVAATGNT